MNTKLRILHLEDNVEDVELVRSSLARGGIECQIEAVSSGTDYMAALREPQFDLILSDSGVPGFDGGAALLAARDRCPEVPFIVVSANALEARASQRTQASAHVAKTELEQLAPVIKDILKGPGEELIEDARQAAYVQGMRRLVTVVQQLSLARNAQTVMDIVRHAARELVDADGASFVLRDGDRCFYAEEDAIGPLWKGQRFPMSACISGWTMLNRQAAAIEDIYLDARIPHDAYRPTFVKSLVMTPIRTAAPIGAIGVYWAEPHRATREEIDLLQALADSTSVAIESVDLLANLEKRVAERTAELQRRSGELEVLNKELEAFSYSVAHDLRSPLITIDGFSQVLVESWGEQLGDTGRDHMERISVAVRRMHRLINDLLELSKIVRAPLHETRVDLSNLARDVAQTLQENSPERIGQIVIADGILVDGDPGLLRIALENLLGNAWKFTSKCANACVELGSRVDRAGRTAFFVRDNGAGFDPRYAAKLFSPFQRLHAQSQFPGTGVGLATVQRIIHRHGGEIWAEGAVDKGACFYFTLLTTQ